MIRLSPFWPYGIRTTNRSSSRRRFTPNMTHEVINSHLCLLYKKNEHIQVIVCQSWYKDVCQKRTRVWYHTTDNKYPLTQTVRSSINSTKSFKRLRQLHRTSTPVTHWVSYQWRVPDWSAPTDVIVRRLMSHDLDSDPFWPSSYHLLGKDAPETRIHQWNAYYSGINTYRIGWDSSSSTMIIYCPFPFDQCLLYPCSKQNHAVKRNAS